MTKDNKKQLSRRDALKLLSAVTSMTALANLPSKWSTPELTSGMLPAHVQTSCPDITGNYTARIDNGVNVLSATIALAGNVYILTIYNDLINPDILSSTFDCQSFIGNGEKYTAAFGTITFDVDLTYNPDGSLTGPYTRNALSTIIHTLELIPTP